MLICARMQINPYLSLHTKVKSKWIKDLYIKRCAQNLIEEKVKNNLEQIGTFDNFLNRVLILQTWKSIVDKWKIMKLKRFCKVKEVVKRKKRAAYIMGRIFINSIWQRDYFQYINKSDVNKPKIHLQMWYRYKEQCIKCSTEISNEQEAFEEMFNIFSYPGNSNQMTLRLHIILVRMIKIIKIKNSSDNSCWQGCGPSYKCIFYLPKVTVISKAYCLGMFT